MSDEGASLGDLMGKSEFISKGEKRRRELEARGHCLAGASGYSNDGNKLSVECKAAVFQALYEWLKETPYTNINKKKLSLREVVGKEAFQSRMRRLFEDAISRDEWDEEKRKSNYSKWLEDKLVDVLYNTAPILDRYMKFQLVPMIQEELVAFQTK
jgi:hypothetical protein